MNKLRFLIVDDSIFSITILSEILESKGYEVVGHALNKDEALSEAINKKPDFITMDMVMPGADGVECSKAILEVLPHANIIAVSSMMDDEIVKSAKKSGIKGYVQKPVDREDLYNTIERIIAFEDDYENLSNIYFDAFLESLQTNMHRTFKTAISSLTEIPHSDESRRSAGICIAVGIIGKYCGRMILDVPNETSLKLAGIVLGKPSDSIDFAVAAIGEFANVVAGNAVSMLNKTNSQLALRVSPPTAFYGRELNMSISEIEGKSAVAVTPYGEIFIHAGFKRGDDEWM